MLQFWRVLRREANSVIIVSHYGLNFCGFDEKVSKIHKLVANDPIKTICYYKLQFTDHWLHGST